MSVNKQHIHAVYVQLEVGQQQNLYVMLAEDGTVNRLGRGTVDNDQHDLFVGTSDQQLFQSFMMEVDEKLFEYSGSYQDTEAVGTTCKLTLLFQYGNEEETTGFEFTYGSESQGPPTEICDLVVSCIDLTEPWFEQQIEQARSSPSGD